MNGRTDALLSIGLEMNGILGELVIFQFLRQLFYRMPALYLRKCCKVKVFTFDNNSIDKRMEQELLLLFDYLILSKLIKI